MTKGASPSGGSPVAAAAGGLAACCTVHLFVLAGVAGSVSGLALGGIAVGAGVVAAAAVWLVAVVVVRRRARGRDVSCRRPEPSNVKESI